MNSPSNMPDQEELKRILDYDPKTGVFKWKVRVSRNIKIWDTAGCTHSHNGYRYISIKDRLYRAHRLAWLYVYGEWPKDQIDHINRIKIDNRISNLRHATSAINSRNRSPCKKNSSGVTGVRWNEKRKRWMAQIKVNGITENLGSYHNKADAIKVRIDADKKYGFYSNRKLFGL
jgi:hypothetical protein